MTTAETEHRRTVQITRIGTKHVKGNHSPMKTEPLQLSGVMDVQDRSDRRGGEQESCSWREWRAQRDRNSFAGCNYPPSGFELEKWALAGFPSLRAHAVDGRLSGLARSSFSFCKRPMRRSVFDGGVGSGGVDGASGLRVAVKSQRCFPWYHKFSSFHWVGGAIWLWGQPQDESTGCRSWF